MAGNRLEEEKEKNKNKKKEKKWLILELFLGATKPFFSLLFDFIPNLF